MKRLSTILSLLLALFALSACPSAPPTREPVALEPGVKIRNVRPNLLNQKAERYLQVGNAYISADVELDEAWSLLSTANLPAEQAEVWRGNGMRVATADPVALSLFLEKINALKGGGLKAWNIAAGNEPIALETTPPVEQAVVVRGLLGLSRDETFKLPAGRTQFLLMLRPQKDEAELEVLPHHHWVTPSITPRDPGAKALDGRLFRELSLTARLAPQQYLLIGYAPPAKPREAEEPVPPVVATDDGAAPPAPAPAAAPVPPTPPPSPPVPAPPDAADKPPLPVKPLFKDQPLPRLGDLLLTGERAGKRLQIVCIIRIPAQGESLEAGEALRPAVREEPGALSEPRP